MKDKKCEIAIWVNVQNFYFNSMKKKTELNVKEEFLGSFQERNNERDAAPEQGTSLDDAN